MKKNLKTLADHFRKKTTKVWQQIGQSMQSSAGVLSEEQRKGVRKAKAECGVCVASHAAEHFGTEIRLVDLASSLNPTLSYHIEKHLPDEECPKLVGVRVYQDGITALYNLLSTGRDFRQWRTDWTGSAHSLVENYLMERCGAPPECFSAVPWPDKTKPADVFDTAHELNFGKEATA